MFAALGWSAAHATESKAADPQVAREYRVQVALDIDAQGHVAATELPSEIPPMLIGPTQDAIRHWRFKPPVREGRAVTARTYAGVTVQLVRRPDSNYGLRVVYGHNGPKLIYSRLPMYPIEALRRRSQGVLVMDMIARPDGSLSDVTVASSRFNGGDTRDFRKVVETVLKQARAEPEWVDGKPVATRVRVPFTFTLDEIPIGEVLSKMAKERPGSMAGADAPTPPIGEAVALDSPVQPLVDGPHS